VVFYTISFWHCCWGTCSYQYQEPIRILETRPLFFFFLAFSYSLFLLHTTYAWYSVYFACTWEVRVNRILFPYVLRWKQQHKSEAEKWESRRKRQRWHQRGTNGAPRLCYAQSRWGWLLYYEAYSWGTQLQVQVSSCHIYGEGSVWRTPLWEPNMHLRNVLAKYNTIKLNGVPKDAIRLRFFQYSHWRIKAVTSYKMSCPTHSPRGTLNAFLSKYFPRAKLQSWEQTLLPLLNEIGSHCMKLGRRVETFSKNVLIMIFLTGS